MKEKKMKSSPVILVFISVFPFLIYGSSREFLYDPSIPFNSKQITVRAGANRDCSDPNNIYLPPTATNTTQRLADLRSEMIKSNYQAYIVPSSDAHLSEYVALRDRKRSWISGMSGSAGTAVVTSTKAALWTDGRYFEQAERELDCNWMLMKTGELGVPTIEEWLADELPAGSAVGANSFLFSINSWIDYSNNLSPNTISMNQSIPDLIDIVWEDRPPLSGLGIMILPLEYAGVSLQTKLQNARTKMISNQINFLLITVLDEIAWLLNLRGGDIPNTPVFTSYIIVPISSNAILYSNVTNFQSDEINEYLNPAGCATDYSCVEVKPYESARDDLLSFATDKVARFWLPSDTTSYGMYSAVGPNQQLSSTSPLKLAKSVKNPTEVASMKQAHIYDAVALCEYLMWLEINVPLGGVDEISGAEVLKGFRSAQPTNQGVSFGSISASGPNGAVIHYGATPETNRNLTIDEMYLVDSGGQYLGGTTDVTRTVHFGEPSAFEKETFTRVLMGQIDVERAVFPYTKKGYDLDIIARRYLYEVGLEYRHGTGHGIGHFLCIHEYPPGFGTSASQNFALQPGMFTSVEPGYYQEGAFGIRHENVDVVVKANTTYNFDGYEFYTFQSVTLVPYQRKLINVQLLSDEQLNFLNAYHRRVMEIVGDEATSQGKGDVTSWIKANTVPINRDNGSQKIGLNSLFLTSVLCCISYLGSIVFT